MLHPIFAKIFCCDTCLQTSILSALQIRYLKDDRTLWRISISAPPDNASTIYCSLAAKLLRPSLGQSDVWKVVRATVFDSSEQQS